tara:strand:- start:764 stop:961 length:198 start_codon:yes stop_codon:yes gene_type:complete
MMEIFGKFVTIDWKLWKQKCFNKEIHFLRVVHDNETLEKSWNPLKFPNGKIFTEKDLLNYKEYKL